MWCDALRNKSIATLLASYQQKDYNIRRAAIVAGSRIDPGSIANPHIRAHALEGRLFPSVLEEALREYRICTDVLVERDAYAQAAAQLKASDDNVRRVIQNFGRVAQPPWRAEQKLAALAAWVALR
jgi:hypothetical protein